MKHPSADTAIAVLVPASGRDRIWRVLRIVVWLVLVWVVARGVLDIVAPTQHAPVAPAAVVQTGSSEVDAFAAAFAREYLTLTPARPDTYALRLEPFLAPGLDKNAGVQIPARSAAQTAGVAIVVRRERIDRARSLVTIAVEVSGKAPGMRYLTVPVYRDRSGALAVYDYPAIAAPSPRAQTVPEVAVEPLPEGEQGAIDKLLERFFTAYLNGDGAELAFVTPVGVRIQPPDQHLELMQIDSVSQLAAPTRRDQLSGVVRLRATDPASGVSLLLAYRVELSKNDRWYVASIHQDQHEGDPS